MKPAVTATALDALLQHTNDDGTAVFETIGIEPLIKNDAPGFMLSVKTESVFLSTTLVQKVRTAVRDEHEEEIVASYTPGGEVAYIW